MFDLNSQNAHVQIRYLNILTWITDVVETIKRLHMWSLEERRNRSDLIEVFKIIKGYTKCEISEFLFILDQDVRILEDTMQNYIK